MKDIWQQITEGLASVGGEEPAVRGAVLLGMGLVGLATMGVSVFRGRRAATRSRVNVDAPPGAEVEVRIGK
jgi:hypothetical protein